MSEAIYTIRVMRDGDDIPMFTGLMSDTHCCCCGKPFERKIVNGDQPYLGCEDCERGEIFKTMPTEAEYIQAAHWINFDIMVYVSFAHKDCWHLRNERNDTSGLDGWFAAKRHEQYLTSLRKPLGSEHLAAAPQAQAAE